MDREHDWRKEVLTGAASCSKTSSWIQKVTISLTCEAFAGHKVILVKKNEMRKYKINL